jgi:hypothetical protein
VSPILGIFASQGRVAPNSYESIATVTVGSGGTSTISFSSIPSTFKHLQLRASCKVNGTAGDFPDLLMRFNSDSTYTNYFSHQIGGDGSSAYANTSNSSPTATGGLVGDINGAQFTGKVIDILDYTNTNKNTTTRTLSGWDSNGSGQSRFASNLWINTSAVTSIDLVVRSSPTTISEYSKFALYGIKG